MQQKVKQFAINALRKASYRWLPRSQALRLSVVEEGEYNIKIDNDRSRKKYQCAHCWGIFRAKEINVDHIDPVVDPEKGFTNFDDYIERMFCEIKGFQILCKECHDIKTAEERVIRKETKDGQKTKKKI